MKSILRWLPSLLLVVTNFVFGSFWIAGYYYCRYVLAILSVIALICVLSDKIHFQIKKLQAKRKAQLEVEEAEERKIEYELMLVSNAAKAETERYLKEEARKEEEKNEEFMLLVAKGVELGLQKALKEKE